MGRPKPRSRVLPSPFMPTRSTSSPTFSGAFQKMRYLGFPDSSFFARVVTLSSPCASAQLHTIKKDTRLFRSNTCAGFRG